MIPRIHGDSIRVTQTTQNLSLFMVCFCGAGLHTLTEYWRVKR